MDRLDRGEPHRRGDEAYVEAFEIDMLRGSEEALSEHRVRLIHLG